MTSRSTYFEGSWVQAKRASEILSSGRSFPPNRAQRFLLLAQMTSIRALSAEPLTG